MTRRKCMKANAKINIHEENQIEKDVRQYMSQSITNNKNCTTPVLSPYHSKMYVLYVPNGDFTADTFESGKMFSREAFNAPDVVIFVTNAVISCAVTPLVEETV